MINFLGGFRKEGLSAEMKGKMRAQIKDTLNVELGNALGAKSNNVSGNIADAMRPALAGLMAGTLVGDKNPNKSVRKVHVEQVIEFGDALEEFLREKGGEISGSSSEELQTLSSDIASLKDQVDEEQVDRTLVKIYAFAKKPE